MDMNRMTLKLQEALQAASAHAMRRSHQGIDIEHLLLALMEQETGLTGPLLEQAGVSPAAVRKATEAALDKLPGARISAWTDLCDAALITGVDPGRTGDARTAR